MDEKHILISFDKDRVRANTFTSMSDVEFYGSLVQAYIATCEGAGVDAREVLDEFMKLCEEDSK